jgi:hypothetical protein
MAIDAAAGRDPTKSKTLQHIIIEERSLQRIGKIQYVIGKRKAKNLQVYGPS